jgi:tRNA uridine 5-carbamoylmethylation protein Kti12
MPIAMMRGIPASGKTTVAREWVAEAPGRRVRVSRDDIRAMLFGAPGHGIDEQLVSQIETAAVNKALAQDLSVIIDACNMSYKYETKWHNWATRYNTSFHILDINVDTATAIARDSRRENPVGEAVILDMVEKRNKLFRLTTK